MQFLAKSAPAILAALLFATAPVFLSATIPALAQNDDAPGTEEDPVVARVNGEEIRRSEVMETAASLPQQYQAQIDLIFPMLVDRLVDLKLIALAAADADLDSDPVVEERLEDLKRDVIRDVFLERYIDANVQDDEVRAAYDEYLEQNPPRPEIKARHILLEKREEAVEVIEALESGAEFEELASERSIGPSAEQGGDLGWFGEGRMVEAFSNAAFGLEAGQYTKEPVETQFGWHVIKVDDRREVEPSNFEEMEPELRQTLAREAVEDLLAELREGAEVEVLVDEGNAAGGDEAPPADEESPDDGDDAGGAN